ncbi:FemAB family XrtA/PEP-CTERM system-associated protein [Thalassoroseus pseudoceratinae]|uniref:FemAB family XrtA/PEP-CTERM system-associated protein n=1 Tax=Thalassoroseus pseudoceratinae TaxID=2713176 RepID=UPI001422BE92|nr:FemAB family XrtA/PEP-CTERM system-associated protein [Thalassoroseus pseudoceratinae]
MTSLRTAPPAIATITPKIIVSQTAPTGWDEYLTQHGYLGFLLRSEWSEILHGSMQQHPHFLTAYAGENIVGVLPLSLLDTWLFGRFLVSLPYLNTGGVLADSAEFANALIDRATQLADELNVRSLELRHETRHEHPRLNAENTSKVHMRLALPETTEQLWNDLKSKVRSQIRKPLNDKRFVAVWGGTELLDDFYQVFCRNMRDLGTPPFPRSLFEGILTAFPNDAEICAVYYEGQLASAALLVHGPGVTQVPSASTIRDFNPTGVNMRMYWHLLCRSVERSQHTFDFGRSTEGSGTYRFKKQWGAQAAPAIWQSLIRKGNANEMRPDNGKFSLAIRVWQKLPIWLTRWIGPRIVRGIP